MQLSQLYSEYNGGGGGSGGSGMSGGGSMGRNTGHGGYTGPSTGGYTGGYQGPSTGGYTGGYQGPSTGGYTGPSSGNNIPQGGCGYAPGSCGGKKPKTPTVTTNPGIKYGTAAIKTSMDDSYYHQNGQYYEIPEGVQVMVNSDHDLLGYMNAGGKMVDISGLKSLTQSQYNNIGVKAGLDAAKASMDATYVHYNGHYYAVPEGMSAMVDSAHNFIGYENAAGHFVNINNMTGFSQAQMNQIGVTEGHKAQVLGMQEGNVGEKEGLAAEHESMDETYYHYNGMFYKLPTNAHILKSSTGAFMGYENAENVTIPLNQMDGLNEDQFKALNIGKYEGQQAAITSMKDSGYKIPGVAGGNGGTRRVYTGPGPINGGDGQEGGNQGQQYYHGNGDEGGNQGGNPMSGGQSEGGQPGHINYGSGITTGGSGGSDPSYMIMLI